MTAMSAQLCTPPLLRLCRLKEGGGGRKGRCLYFTVSVRLVGVEEEMLKGLQRAL